MVYMYHSFLIHSSADGHLGCFHVLVIINSAAMNIGVHVSLSDLVYKSFSCILNMLYQVRFADSFPIFICLASFLIMCFDEQNLSFILINYILSHLNCMVISFCGLRKICTFWDFPLGAVVRTLSFPGVAN